MPGLRAVRLIVKGTSDHGHHLVRAAREVGRLGAAGGARAAPRCRLGRARRRKALLVSSSENAIDETLDGLSTAWFPRWHRYRPGSLRGRPDPATDPAQVRRDAGELRCSKPRSSGSADSRDLPRLQLLNVFAGEISCSSSRRPGPQRPQGDAGVLSQHPVDVKEGVGWPRSSATGTKRALDHHQGVARWEDIVESAWAADGSLEGLEDPSKRFAVAVLWHPEMKTTTSACSKPSSTRRVAFVPSGVRRKGHWLSREASAVPGVSPVLAVSTPIRSRPDCADIVTIDNTRFVA